MADADEIDGVTRPQVQTLNVRLDANGVAAPARLAAAMVAEVVAGCLRAFEADDLARPAALAGFTFVIDLGLPAMTTEQRRQMYSTWLIAKGFQDLLRGVRTSLEEAALFLAILSRAPRTGTIGGFNAFVADTRRAASRLTFPALVEEVNRGLRLPMAYSAEFQSLQTARNCLEHRAGLVSQQDVDPKTKRLTVSFPRLKVFYLRDGKELDIIPGAIADTGDGASAFDILIKREIASKSFALGDQIAFSSAEFIEIAMSCHIFAGDLATRLPVAVEQVPERGPETRAG